MSSASDKEPCDAERVSLHAARALPSSEATAMEAHIASCLDCRHEFQMLRWIVDSLASWSTDVLRPSASLWDRLETRVQRESGGTQLSTPLHPWPEPEWEEVAPGISCKVLSTDTESNRVTMLVRLAPGVDYPPHTHADVEQLYLLWGELWINDRKLEPGDYNRAERGTADRRVWSGTGCTCVLITSTQDALRANGPA